MTLVERSLIVCGVAAIAVACSALRQGQDNIQPQIAARADRSGSWMAPAASEVKRLLYISDGDATVDVYNYETGKLVGQLIGFEKPLGQCVDGAGDIWISDYQAQTMNEYARGTTRVLKTLSSHYRPFGCSISPSGDLAVSEGPLTSENDVIQVWNDASGSPVTYEPQNPNCYDLSAPGYGEDGGLYAEGDFSTTSEYLLHVCKAIPKTQRLEQVTFASAIHGLAGVMWDGRHIAVMAGATSATKHWAIYRVVAESGLRMVHAGKTLLKGTCDGPVRVWHPFIVGTQNTPVNHTEAHEVVGPDAGCPGEIGYWRYPAGEAPYKTMKNAPSDITGDSVSISP
jgi:WD40 repeat protein